jgi:hypothetical protein
MKEPTHPSPEQIKCDTGNLICQAIRNQMRANRRAFMGEYNERIMLHGFIFNILHWNELVNNKNLN